MPLKSKLLLSILKDYGYILSSQRGSHMKFRKDSNSILAPNHKELKPGTAQSILKDFCKQNNMDYHTLIKKYKIKL